MRQTNASASGRLLGLSLAVFVSAVLLYEASQLLYTIRWWLIGGAAGVFGVLILLSIRRARRDRW